MSNFLFASRKLAVSTGMLHPQINRVCRSNLPVAATVTFTRNIHSNNTEKQNNIAKRPMSSAATIPNTPQPISTFDNPRVAYATSTSFELARAIAVFQICKIKPLVANSRALINLSYKVLGDRFTNGAMKVFFFGHFCGGETQEEIRDKVAILKKSGIGSILDYAAEEDVAEEHNIPDEAVPKDSKISQDQITARTYSYTDEAHCDINMGITMYAIEAAASSDDQAGSFAAVKMTSLGKPNFLEHVSQLLLETRRIFGKLTDGDTDSRIPYGERKLTYDLFANGIIESGLALNEKEAKALFDKADSDKNGYVDFYEWTSLIDSKSLSLGKLDKFRNKSHLTPEEIGRYENMINRVDTLCKAAAEKNVRLLIDAEQTYMQTAIDHIVVEMQRKYNKKTAIVYNTIQCYKNNAQDKLVAELDRARREKFWYGAKLVRGAYMIQERARADQLGYRDPIQVDINATHECYNGAVEIMLKNNDICDLMVASHNETTVLKTIDWINSNYKPRPNSVCFGQLLGMCDHISYTLGGSGYGVYKYVPYGPIHEVLPYLIRRAEENGDVLSSSDKETKMMIAELKRRLTT